MTQVSTQQTLNFEAISQSLLPHLEDILTNFGIKYNTHWNRLSMPCPIHGSDKLDSLCIFTKISNKGLIGNWCCFTNSCHSEYGRNLLGFIKGVLSRNEKVNISYVLNWCKKYLDGDLKDYTVDTDKQNFIRINQTLSAYTKCKFQIDRATFRKKLIIPPEYYLNRGYTSSILTRYDIGTCNDSSKPFYGRILVPLYDPKHVSIIAVLARSPHSKCNKCGEFHDGDCKPGAKWMNAGFTSGILFNYWMSKNHIRNNGKCVIVEGCGDVLKLEQAGIYNSVALNTNNISYGQQLILEKSGATRLILALDSDAKGEEGKEKIIKKLSRFYSIEEIKLPEKDFGDMNTEEIKTIFKRYK